MRKRILLIFTIFYLSVLAYGQKDSLSNNVLKKIDTSKQKIQLNDTIFFKQIDEIQNANHNNFDLKLWLPTLTELLVLIITNLVTLYKIKKDTTESIKKDIIISKIKIQREKLEKFYDPIFTTLKTNESIFNAYGPSSFPRDGGVLETEASVVWKQIIENVILPNNKKIESVIQQFSHLKNENDNIDLYLDFLVHIESYDHFIKTPNTLHKAFKYPSGFIENVIKNRNEIIENLRKIENKLNI